MGLQNRIFHDDVKLERIVPVSSGKLSIVTSQPYIKGRDATQPEIDAIILSIGFEIIGVGAYYKADEGIVAYDLLPKNAKVDAYGFVQPIDPVIQRVTPEFVDFLREYLNR